MAKVLLTGAAGSIGYEALKQLIAAGHEVTAFDIDSRHNFRKLHKYQAKARIVYGDIRDRKLVDRLIKDQDIIIHLAALIPPKADKDPKITRAINFGGTKNIVEAIQEINPKSFLIFSSSVSVYGDRTGNPWIKITDPLKPSQGDHYAEIKIITEKYIRSANINHTIFRFTAIMNRPQTDPLMFHMPLETKLEIATVFDTARALVKAIDHTKTLNGHIYNLAGGKKCRTTYREFLIHMFKIYGLQYKYLKSVAFAKKNFHCGYFLDSDDLENILHFRRDTLQDYYRTIDRETNKLTRFFSKIFSRPIIYFLTKKSEPLQAVKKHNLKLIRRFFGRDKT